MKRGAPFEWEKLWLRSDNNNNGSQPVWLVFYAFLHCQPFTKRGEENKFLMETMQIMFRLLLGSWKTSRLSSASWTGSGSLLKLEEYSSFEFSHEQII